MAFESDSGSSVGAASPAFADIRLAEAARMLGMLSADGLRKRAAGWRAGGVDTHNVRALEATAEGPDVSAGVRLALVAEIARELGIGFASLTEARSAQAEEVIRSMSAGEQVGTQIFDLSNGATDEFTARVRAFFGRLLHRD